MLIFDLRFHFRWYVFQSKLTNLKSQILDLFFEYSSPVLKTLEHVKAGTSRREQNNIAALGRRERSRYSIMHVGRMLKRRGVFQFRFDRRRVFADQNHFANELLNQWGQRRIRRLLTAAPENQNDLAGVV